MKVFLSAALKRNFLAQREVRQWGLCKSWARMFGEHCCDKIKVLFNLNNMYKRYSRKYRGQEEGVALSEIIGILWWLFVLIALYFGVIYKMNQEKFWREMNHYVLPALGVVVFIFAVYIFYLYQSKKKKEHRFENVLQQITQTSFESSINSFIDRFGKEGKVNSWEYRGYAFDWKRLDDFRENANQNKVDISTKDYRELTAVLRHFIDKKEKSFLNEGIETKVAHSLSDLSKRGDDFEHLVVRLYDAMGYASKRIGGHGDQGGDVLASKNGENILIQAKCYQGTVGNAAVQQAVGAKSYYGCTRSVVITTSSFTSEAVALAKSNSVELIDGKLLKQRLLEYLGEMWQ